MLPGIELCVQNLPDCPAIKLWLFDQTSLPIPIQQEQFESIWRHPCYWGFCWASGQVLAQQILANPKPYQHKTIIDFGAGSGVVAIAAALAGAKRVIACDLDPLALASCAANAKLNQVSLELCDDILSLDHQADWVIAADVLYDLENLAWLDELPKFGQQVLIADSRIKHWPRNDYQRIAEQKSDTVPDLGESFEFGNVRLYQYESPISLKRET